MEIKNTEPIYKTGSRIDDMESNITLLNENSEVINRLLIDMVNNQKENYKGFKKVFIVTVICLTFIIISMITGFFIYESQFETLQTVTTQEADAQGGNAIINGSGEMYYGESTSDNSK